LATATPRRSSRETAQWTGSAPAGSTRRRSFYRLLDAARGGYFRTAPGGPFSVERRYRGPTNVLEMTFLAHGGQVRAIDLMPVHQRTAHRQGYDVGAGHRLLRHLECLEGEVELTLEFKPTFDYSRAHTNCDPRAGREAIAHAGARHLTLACDGVQAHGRITVSALSRPRPW
jgi:hypothetical protein